MSKRLRDNISSKYLEAANRLHSKTARRRIVAYVESYDDVFFWRTVLSMYEDETRYFEVLLPSTRTLERGKKSAIMRILGDGVGRDMIACVDADYDYLIQGATETSRKVIGNPFVFHTFAYSIENLQCYAPSLHNVCVAVTLNDHQLLDLHEFMRQYSITIFPLFVWSIWHYRRPIYTDFTITDFNRVIDFGGFKIDNPYATITHVRHKVGKYVAMLQRKHPDAKESYLKLKRELTEELGVKPDETYLYIQGHHLFERAVVPMLDKVCSQLIREREAEIRQQAMHQTQMRNELSCYSHSTQDIEQMLKKNTAYIASPVFRRIQQSLEDYLSQ
ncbi:MAG: DUF4435 domain-containing protein [Prevotella sp.]|uniref:DUF4435 domain-containing protein n=1 Tax=Prevotella sp. TaxID=59823 RepID=UPI002A256A1D|nr:DUF4435 domain-containing protein [Prevotella sp.]MDD7318492.1 DUF4435 domain-containing protein [Prevotellaceae bacterium]MDY4020297.1 DUF4435 domain-containing protein [Prevotella sp.]